jgi:thiosulfate/3-mercaptopyruvate sulfurtransferase
MNSPVVSAQWLKENLADPDLVISDSSQQANQSKVLAQHQDIQIVGARFFDIKNDFSDTSNPLPNSLPTPESFASAARNLGINATSKIVVYDSLGIYSSPRVWWLFKIMGHKNVWVLDGGLPAWHDKKYPMEKSRITAHKIGNFVAKFDVNAVKSTNEVLDNIDSKLAVLIDARSKDRFLGLTAEPRAGLRSGHIPGAINIPYTEVVQNGHFLSREKLVTLLPKFNQPLIFSCGSGVTACIVLLAYELVKEANLKAVYDGSWTAWGLDEKLPIAT